MGITAIQAGGIDARPRQPSPLSNWLASQSAPSTWGPSRVGLALLIFFVATGASAAPARLRTARFRGDCNSYTFTVTGEGLKQPNPVVSYNITLTPPAGEPMTIVDSFAVVPESDGKFHKTVHGTWEKFEFALRGKYTLSGSAILISDLSLLHTLVIVFPRREILNCNARQRAKS